MANFRTNLAGCSGRERRHSGRGSDDTRRERRHPGRGSDDIVFLILYIFLLGMFCTKIHIPIQQKMQLKSWICVCNSFSIEVFMSMVCFTSIYRCGRF
jgi:hypothetical protein